MCDVEKLTQASQKHDVDDIKDTASVTDERDIFQSLMFSPSQMQNPPRHQTGISKNHQNPFEDEVFVNPYPTTTNTNSIMDIT